MSRSSPGCRVGVAKGADLLRYAFPAPHPFTGERVVRFWEELERLQLAVSYVEPQMASQDAVELFHERGHYEFVRKASVLGYGDLDEGDTPAFHGILDAARFAVGSTLALTGGITDGSLDHAFNPVGGLHHARRNASAGFCVFNDVGVAIESLRRLGIDRILYVDIDVHHGDGVFYSYESDDKVFVFDVHEDGRFLYPGTGSVDETGSGPATGTKVNLPLPPGAGDKEVLEIIPRLQAFASESRPEFVIFQCGADGMRGDPLGGLTYSEETYCRVARIMHAQAHESAGGRMLALGGGGYSPENCARAWSRVVAEMMKTDGQEITKRI